MSQDGSHEQHQRVPTTAHTTPRDGLAPTHTRRRVASHTHPCNGQRPRAHTLARWIGRKRSSMTSTNDDRRRRAKKERLPTASRLEPRNLGTSEGRKAARPLGPQPPRRVSSRRRSDIHYATSCTAVPVPVPVPAPVPVTGALGRDPTCYVSTAHPRRDPIEK